MTRVLFALLVAVFLAVSAASAQPRSDRAAQRGDMPDYGTLSRVVGAMQEGVGGCNINPDVYEFELDRCVALGGPPRQCATLALHAACEPQVVAPVDPPTPSGGNPFADLATAGDLKVFDPSIAGRTAGCEGPKPSDIGCTTLCKPCITYICLDGEWQAQRIDFPDEICRPIRTGSGPSATACPRGPNGFCPAECSVCF